MLKYYTKLARPQKEGPYSLGTMRTTQAVRDTATVRHFFASNIFHWAVRSQLIKTHKKFKWALLQYNTIQLYCRRGKFLLQQ